MNLHVSLHLPVHYSIMADPIELAVAYNEAHPSESYLAVSEHFLVPKSTLYDRSKGVHLNHAAAAH